MDKNKRNEKNRFNQVGASFGVEYVDAQTVVGGQYRQKVLNIIRISKSPNRL